MYLKKMNRERKKSSTPADGNALILTRILPRKRRRFESASR